MTAEEQEKACKHLEKAQQTDDLGTKNYHIREALQLLRIADDASHCAIDTTEEPVD